MSKNLINPFEEVVVFGKAYPVALPVPRSTTIRALVPTGSHVGHGNKLTHVHNGKGGGGKATKLERYTGGHANQRVGPFGKALSRVPRGGSEQAGVIWRQMSPLGRRGRTAGTRDAVTAMRNQARGRTMNFQDPGGRGSRLG